MVVLRLPQLRPEGEVQAVALLLAAALTERRVEQHLVDVDRVGRAGEGVVVVGRLRVERVDRVVRQLPLLEVLRRELLFRVSPQLAQAVHLRQDVEAHVPVRQDVRAVDLVDLVEERTDELQLVVVEADLDLRAAQGLHGLGVSVDAFHHADLGGDLLPGTPLGDQRLQLLTVLPLARLLQEAAVHLAENAGDVLVVVRLELRDERVLADHVPQRELRHLLGRRVEVRDERDGARGVCLLREPDVVDDVDLDVGEGQFERAGGVEDRLVVLHVAVDVRVHHVGVGAVQPAAGVEVAAAAVRAGAARLVVVRHLVGEAGDVLVQVLQLGLVLVALVDLVRKLRVLVFLPELGLGHMVADGRLIIGDHLLDGAAVGHVDLLDEEDALPLAEPLLVPHCLVMMYNVD